MSHSVNIKTKFKNIDLLLEQFKLKGWRIVENQCRNTYPSDPTGKTPNKYVAKNPQPRGYDVGIDVDDEGNATFVYDPYDRGVEQQLGNRLRDIKQNYTLSIVNKALEYEDLRYNVERLPNGELIITADEE